MSALLLDWMNSKSIFGPMMERLNWLNNEKIGFKSIASISGAILEHGARETAAFMHALKMGLI